MMEAVGEEVVHKVYIAHLPPKWQKYHEVNGVREKPLLLRQKTRFAHMLLKAADAAAGDPGAGPAATGQLRRKMTAGDSEPRATRGRAGRLEELLAFKESTETREQARKETEKLAGMVALHKENLQKRRERGLRAHERELLSGGASGRGGELLQLCSAAGTVHRREVGQRRADDAADRRKAGLEAKARRLLATTSKRLQDIAADPAAFAAPRRRAQHGRHLLSLKHAAANPGYFREDFLQPPGKPPAGGGAPGKNTLPGLFETVAKQAGSVGGLLENAAREASRAEAARRHASVQRQEAERAARLRASLERYDGRCAAAERQAAGRRRRPETGCGGVPPGDDGGEDQDPGPPRSLSCPPVADKAAVDETDRLWQEYEDNLALKYHWQLVVSERQRAAAEAERAARRAREDRADARLAAAVARRRLAACDAKDDAKDRRAVETARREKREAALARRAEARAVPSSPAKTAASPPRHSPTSEAAYAARLAATLHRKRDQEHDTELHRLEAAAGKEEAAEARLSETRAGDGERREALAREVDRRRDKALSCALQTRVLKLESVENRIEAGEAAYEARRRERAADQREARRAAKDAEKHRSEIAAKRAEHEAGEKSRKQAAQRERWRGVVLKREEQAARSQEEARRAAAGKQARIEAALSQVRADDESRRAALVDRLAAKVRRGSDEFLADATSVRSQSPPAAIARSPTDLDGPVPTDPVQQPAQQQQQQQQQQQACPSPVTSPSQVPLDRRLELAQQTRSRLAADAVERRREHLAAAARIEERQMARLEGRVRTIEALEESRKAREARAAEIKRDALALRSQHNSASVHSRSP
ncbi:hypothetical protein DIPPA_22655 [Diplonema papillatum]|nr:hypothetical protein DIPPA_22655 [Diplonema papillatum]